MVWLCFIAYMLHAFSLRHSFDHELELELELQTQREHGEGDERAIDERAPARESHM